MDSGIVGGQSGDVVMEGDIPPIATHAKVMDDYWPSSSAKANALCRK